MRIFYFARIDIAYMDASSRHVTEFCRQFARLGHTVTLFVPDMGSRPETEGIQTVYVPVGWRHPAVTFISFYFFLLFYFLAHYFRQRPDVVYTRHQQMEWLVTWLRYVLDFTYVIEVNGLSFVEQKIHDNPDWVIKLTRRMERIVFRMAHKMVTSSGQLQEILCREYRLKPEHFCVVSNGANPELFKPMDQARCREQLHLEADNPYLIFIGSLKRWHGLDQIVGAMPALAEKIPGIHLMIVGEGEQRTQVERMVRENGLENTVTLFGEKLFEEVPYYINAADICLGSFSDKPGISPLKIFDYMACGKPIVSNAVGGMDALIQSTQSGKLIHSQNAQAWIPPIVELMEDPGQRRTLGENGRKAVLETYNWESICRKIAAAIEAARA